MLAQPALAQEFEASTGPVRGAAVGTQVFKLKPLVIRCARAKSTGDVEDPVTATIVDEVAYAKCATFDTPVRFGAPIQFEYNIAGFVRILNTVAIHIPAIKCTATIEPQRIPASEAVKKSPVSYANEVLKVGGKPFEELFPRGQKKLLIKNRLKEISYSLEGGLCGELESGSGSAGAYTGELHDEIAGGNLGVPLT
jgi:hypothetical protein